MELLIEDSIETSLKPQEEDKGEDIKMEFTEEDWKELEKFEHINNKEIDLSLDPKVQFRRVPVPPHRITPLKSNWDTILKTLVKHMKLQVRMNTKRRCVELKTCKETVDIGAI